MAFIAVLPPSLSVLWLVEYERIEPAPFRIMVPTSSTGSKRGGTGIKYLLTLLAIAPSDLRRHACSPSLSGLSKCCGKTTEATCPVLTSCVHLQPPSLCMVNPSIEAT